MPTSIRVFFYGLFIDPALLAKQGVLATNIVRAVIHGYALRIGNRASIVPEPGALVHGMIMSIDRADIARLYATASLSAYEPEAVLAHVDDGGVEAALCYSLPEPPAMDSRNEAYAAELKTVAARLGFPDEYVARI